MYKTLKSKEIFKHHRITLIEEKIKLPNGKISDYLLFKDDGGSSATVICKKNNKFLMIKDYYHPLRRKIFMFVGGAIGKKETVKQGAIRELKEEADLLAKKLILIGVFFKNPRRSITKNYVYFTDNFVSGLFDSDDEEDIEKFWLTEKEVDKIILKSKTEACSVSAWGLYKLNKSKLKNK